MKPDRSAPETDTPRTPGTRAPGFPYHPIRHPDPLAVGETIRLERPAVQALRFRQVNPKEAFTIRDAEGRYFRATLLGAGPRSGEALVYEQMEGSPESPVVLNLVCAVLARQRMLFVTQKATELGVARVLPVFTERSVGPDGLEHEKAHAWPGQALRATRQCRRASVPEVRPAVPLAEMLESEGWRGAGGRYFLDHRPGGAFRVERGPELVFLAAGPEGGWTDAERALLERAGATPLSMGPRVLRAETAVVAGLTLVQYELGDLGSRQVRRSEGPVSPAGPPGR